MTLSWQGTVCWIGVVIILDLAEDVVEAWLADEESTIGVLDWADCLGLEVNEVFVIFSRCKDKPVKTNGVERYKYRGTDVCMLKFLEQRQCPFSLNPYIPIVK